MVWEEEMVVEMLLLTTCHLSFSLIYFLYFVLTSTFSTVWGGKILLRSSAFGKIDVCMGVFSQEVVLAIFSSDQGEKALHLINRLLSCYGSISSFKLASISTI